MRQFSIFRSLIFLFASHCVFPGIALAQSVTTFDMLVATETLTVGDLNYLSFQTAGISSYTTVGKSLFTVPSGTSQIFVKAWGGGGGGGGSGNCYTWHAGDGAGGSFASGLIGVTPGQVLTVWVGSGGISTGTFGENYVGRLPGGAGLSSTAGGSGGTGGLSLNIGGGGGGAASGVFLVTTSTVGLVVAGGGGGGGSYNKNTGPNGGSASAQGVGGAGNANGNSGTDSSSGYGGGGGGGGATSGGTGGAADPGLGGATGNSLGTKIIYGSGRTAGHRPGCCGKLKSVTSG